MVAVVSLCRCVCVDTVLRCVQCASFPCRGRSHHYRPRNGDAATMCVCVCVFVSFVPRFIFLLLFLLFTLCADLLTDFSTSTTTTTADGDDGGDEGMVRVETEVLCGSKDSGGHWRLVGESNWTACRADTTPDSKDLMEEEASNAIVCDSAARSCSDYDGTNNSGETEEFMNIDLTTPNTADVYSDGTISTALEHPLPPPRSLQTAVRAAAPHRAHLQSRKSKRAEEVLFEGDNSLPTVSSGEITASWVDTPLPLLLLGLSGVVAVF
ncbi:hypothetical protein MOQ_002161 [Trypanosoma cruzi marinkellei]|uniref:Uncharacterized protein n=1 Tax=Trypanosoma cruzi marinkellei TaxID=85056 RepID=K2NIU3_TRYCR|nr:hypothetical protein MOQ_002161 [Trypanosoma cruzi marinkellei]